MSDYNLIIILGATASGKTRLAVHLAHDISGEIISADSRQIFRQMDIGTGKDLREYNIGDQHVPYHLIDILPPGHRYNVDAFKNDFYDAIDSIILRKKMSVLCGGTGMYIHSLLQNQDYTAVRVNERLRSALGALSKEELINKLQAYEKQTTQHADLSSKKRLIRAIEIAAYLKTDKLEIKKRPTLKPIVFGLKTEVEITRSKILSRLHHRLRNGMIEEVAQLLKDGVDKDTLIFYGLEYKFIVNYLDGLLSFDELENKLGIAICQYAKRQNTFFRKMEKDGVAINWLNGMEEVNLLKQRITDKVSGKI